MDFRALLTMLMQNHNRKILLDFNEAYTSYTVILLPSFILGSYGILCPTLKH